jgi:hypothetical protein
VSIEGKGRAEEEPFLPTEVLGFIACTTIPQKPGRSPGPGKFTEEEVQTHRQMKSSPLHREDANPSQAHKRPQRRTHRRADVEQRACPAPSQAIPWSTLAWLWTQVRV